MKLHALLFTDVVDSTLLVQRLGDERAAHLWAEHDRRARQLLGSHRGHEIDRTDGYFVLFDDVLDAARFALAYHREVAALDLRARIAIHHGAVTLRENTAEEIARGAKRIEVEGLAKPLAARILSLAGGGRTLISQAARDALVAAAPQGLQVDSHGHYRLKGVDDPVPIFELGGPGDAPPADTDKAYRVALVDGLWQPLRAIRHNLPLERDAFVGRSAELRALAQRLDDGTRLLSVLGVGGTGKTRLVRRYALAWLGDWPGGVYFCDLSEARSVEGICFAVASALEVALGKDDPVVQLGHSIAARGRCLVILDNFEQVTVHAAATLACWLDGTRVAHFIVTSRELLHLRGEEVLHVEPLELAGEAVQLFEARAKSRVTGYALDAAGRADVQALMRLLDGLPLAIELAAARVRVLSPAQIVQRLKDRFALLAGASGHAARQATLKAAIDWSWDLLAPYEQAALAQGSVFEGGFTLEAAEAVFDLQRWPEAPAVMDVVQALVDKSLLRAWHAPARLDIAEPHFGMFLSIRDYAAEKLHTFGGTQDAERAHGAYYARLGHDEAVEALCRHGGTARRHALTLEIDNLVAACRRAMSRGDAAVAAATYRAACEVIVLQGPFALAVELGTQVLAMLGLTGASQCAVRLTHAHVMWRAGRSEMARALLVDTLDQARARADRRCEAGALHRLGILDEEQGRPVEGRLQLEQAIDIEQALGNRLAEAAVRGDLGNLYRHLDRDDEARSQYEAALVIHREVGDRRHEGLVLGSLGNLHGAQGRMNEARMHFLQAIDIHREVGDHSMVGVVLGNLANVHERQGRLDASGRCYEEALTVIRGVGSRRHEGQVLAGFASLRGSQGRLGEARSHFESALQIARELKHRRLEGLVLGNLGTLHRDQHRPEEALRCYQASLDVHRALGVRHSTAVVLGYLADLLLQQGRTEAAGEALREGEALLRQIDNPHELARLLAVRVRAEAAAHREDAARATLDEVRALAQALRAGPDSELGREIARLDAALA